MPNWVDNILGAHDEQGVKFIFDNCINNNSFTFNKLIPMPKILMKGSSPARICNNFDDFITMYGKYVDFTFEKEGMLSCGYDAVMTSECSQNLIRKYGTNNWYDWSLNNWGCKWDARMSDPVEIGNYEFRFETPWSIPEKFIKTFALRAYEKCPNSSFTWWWEEEQGFGQEFFIESGKITITKDWDMPYFDEHNVVIHFSSGKERNVILTKVTGGYPERYGNGGWYVDRDESYYYETPFHALGNAVSQEIIQIDNIDELCQYIQKEDVKYPFYGIENKFGEELKILIQKKIA